MGLVDVAKILFLPALVAALLYALLAYVLLPLLRTHRDRYRQYLPLDSLSQRTSSLRDRCTDAVVRFIVSRGQRRRGAAAVDDASDETDGGDGGVRGFGGRGPGARDSSSEDGEDAVFPAEDAERMLGFDLRRSDRERAIPGGGFRS